MRIDVGKEFSQRLVYRDKQQGEGTFNASEFREKYLKDLENNDWWQDDSKYIELDFSNVKTLSPSWANEAFAYYTSDHKPKMIFKKIRFVNISNVKEAIIKLEVDTGHLRK